MKLSEAIEEFLASRALRSPETRRTYEERLGLLSRYAGTDATVEKVMTSAWWRKFFVYLQQEHKNRRTGKALSPVTIDDARRSANAFANFLVSEGRISLNPLRKVELDAPPPRPVPALSYEDARRVADFWSPHDTPQGYSTKALGKDRARFLAVRNRAVIKLLLDSALRLRELTGLNVDSVLWDERRVTLLRTKSGQPRTVPFSQETARALRVYREERTKWFEGKIPTDEEGEPFFLTFEGIRLTKRALHVMTSRIKRDLGLKKFHPHVCRHTSLTLARRNGLDLFQLQAFSGHRNLNSLRAYQQVTDQELSAAHDRASPLNGTPSNLRTYQNNERTRGQ